jgi:hypothetical protein
MRLADASLGHEKMSAAPMIYPFLANRQCDPKGGFRAMQHSAAPCNGILLDLQVVI